MAAESSKNTKLTWNPLAQLSLQNQSIFQTTNAGHTDTRHVNQSRDHVILIEGPVLKASYGI